MSSEAGTAAAVAPKRQRGKRRVAELLAAGAAIFAEKGYAATTMTEIAARAGAPIGSLYQFFPSKETLADTLVQNYVALLTADLEALEARAGNVSTAALIDGLFGVLRAHPKERAATLPLAEARMDERTRRETFRYLLRKRIAAILRARSPTLSAEVARDRAIVVLQLMKAASSLNEEEGLSGRSTALRELQALAAHYLEQR
jgi:AcrR family transcriptional regulator